MGKLTYLVIHTADTPYDRNVTADDIVSWHLGACKNSDGTYTYLGKRFSRTMLMKQLLTLPSGKKINAANTNGRGWSKPGYADFIKRDGTVEKLQKYNEDSIVDPWEITNGAAGYNSVSRHICLAGGWSKDGKIKNGKSSNGKYLKAEDLYTEAQIKSLIDYIKKIKELHPTIKIVGHNNLSQKTCPNFDVKEFLKEHNL